MDSRTLPTQGAASEAELLQLIKTRMPGVYGHITRKAQEQGKTVYALVRRGLRGERNCFWAMEAGFVVGTPFGSDHPVAAATAQSLVQFGCAYVCTMAEVQHGAH